MSAPDAPAPAPAAGKSPWPLILAVFVAFWVVYLMVGGPRRPNDLDGPEPGRPAEYNWTLRDLDGGEVKFDRYRGKTLFLNIWATWCPPCVAEMPSIARLAASEELKGKVEFVCVATDESMNAVRSFLRGKDWPMTILHATALPPVFLTDGIPATFLIAPDGRVAYMREGSAEWDSPDVVRKLRELTERPLPSASFAPTGTNSPVDANAATSN